MDKQFEILVVGRANADLVLKDYKHTVDVAEKRVILEKGDKKIQIETDVAPSQDVDKVTAVRDLGDIVNNLDSMFRWGGGGINSAIALNELRTTLPQAGITFLGPTRPDLTMGNKQLDLIAHLEKNDINWHLMNLLKLNFNLVLPGSNKLIIRNKSRGEEQFKLTREQCGTILQYVNPSEGVLINSLGHAQTSSFIVKNIHEDNQAFYAIQKNLHGKKIEELYNGPEVHALPKFRRVVTVVTPSKNITRNNWINDIFPYSTLIFNQDELLRIFYGKNKDNINQVIERAEKPAEKLKPALLAMAQLRYGIPTEHGVMRKIEDPYNNVYVTLGKDGHLVSIGETVYHVRMKKHLSEELKKSIEQNRSSTTGAGDSFAAAIILQETLGKGKQYLETGAVACTSVNKYLGFLKTVGISDVETVAEYDLNDHLWPNPLDQEK